MSQTPLFSILALALSLVTGRAQSPKPLTEGDLFKNADPITGDLLNQKPLATFGEKTAGFEGEARQPDRDHRE